MPTKPFSTDDSPVPKLITGQRDKTILELRQQGLSIREITKALKLSRNTVRRVIRKSPLSNEENHGAEACKESSPQQWHPLIEQLPELYRQARGNGVRIQELAQEQYGIEVSYSTLTRIIRDQGLRDVTPKRSGEYRFEPGAEISMIPLPT